MTEQEFFDILLGCWFLLAIVTFVVLLRWSAPYGRHTRGGWGPTLGTRAGWFLMEVPASLLFLLWFVVGSNPLSVPLLAFFLMWQVHYVHRAFIYPFSLGGSVRRMPLAIVAFGFVFNVVNTYLNGRYLFTLSYGYPDDWLTGPRFIVGLTLFAAGYVLNRHSDLVLRAERTRTGERYCVIEGGIFRYICCPNYLGEILIWVGWATATWSLAGLSFAVWAMANLLPRARTHLRWCRDYFEDYPEGRKAIIPGLW
ncbi:MAG: DUF1295 domain-containing protein [Dehalococcoidia bacterium]|nr:DUF1295 domain-containing protein [Dehalococcoidia bacterium]